MLIFANLQLEYKGGCRCFFEKFQHHVHLIKLHNLVQSCAQKKLDAQLLAVPSVMLTSN